MGVHLQWNAQREISVQLSFQAVLDPVRYSSRSQRVATDSVIDVFMAEGEYNVVGLGPSVMEGELAKFFVPDFQMPFDVSVRWPGESSFPFGGKQNSHPTNIKVVRTLTGATQSYGKLSVHV